MKKFLFYIGLLFVSLNSFAQPGIEGMNPKKEEKIKALYVAYMTEKLNLTPNDAAAFWPVQQQFSQESRAVNIAGGNEIDRQQSVLNIKKKYQVSFQKILGADRTNRFFVLDDEFREKMIQRLKQMRQNRQNGGGRQGGALQRERQF